MPPRRRFRYLHPPIDGNYPPPPGGWRDLEQLVQLAAGDAIWGETAPAPNPKAVYEEPPGSDAGPRLLPMWGWSGGRVGTPWAACYIVWLFGRYFKYIAEEKFDRKVILGRTPLRQQFARLGSANISSKWKGADKHATKQGYDEQWVWFTYESAATNDVPVRAGDLLYWKQRNEDTEVNAVWEQIYDGTYDGPGGVGVCTGNVDIFNGRPYWQVYGGNLEDSVRNFDIGSELDIVGFLRWIGPPPDICKIDYPPGRHDNEDSWG